MKHLVHHTVFFLTVVLACWTSSTGLAEGTKNEGFILNQGQWPDSILARANFDFGDVILKKDGITFFLFDKSHLHRHGTIQQDSISYLRAHAYKMKFRNSIMHMPKGYDASTFTVNILKGDDPSKWANGLLCYKKLVVENIYPFIDLILYVTEGNLKYDLLVKDKANPKQIVIDYEGIDDLAIDTEGNLQIKTSLGNVIEQMPIAYIEKATLSKERVLCQYKIDDQSVRFKFKNLSRSREEKLVIDPALIFATYSQSKADNWGNTATYDASGCLYAAGISFDRGFPATIGAYDTSFNSIYRENFPRPGTLLGNTGEPDVAIMKFNPNGTLLYATYLGGGISETPTSIIVNAKNELYILGTTGSDGSLGAKFPTTPGAYDVTFNGGSSIYPLGMSESIFHPHGADLFIAKISKNGDSLLSSTLLGGSGNDGMLFHTEYLARNYGDVFRSEILLDSIGDVYIASHTQSNDIINTARPGYNKTFSGGGRDGIVVKMKSDLSDIIWNTYFGGSGSDACYSLQFGADNSLFVCGGTTSTNLPASGGLIKTYVGSVDGFIFNLSKEGDALLNATYLNNNNPVASEQCYLIQTDNEGFVYVLGQNSGTYPVINAPYSNPGSHQFIHKLNPALTQTKFSTVIGSGQNKIDLVPTAFLVNECGNIFISGWGGDVNAPRSFYYIGTDRLPHLAEIAGPNYQGGTTKGLPTTSDAFQKNTDENDFYLMVLKKDVNKLLYATFFGGVNEIEHVDGGTSRFDKRGIVYQAVCAGCGGTSNFPVTDGTKNRSENCNNAVFKFDLSSLKADFIADTLHRCGIGPLTFTNKSIGGVSFLWDLGDGTTSTSSTTVTHTYAQTGTYTVKLTAFDEATCIGVDIMQKNVTIDSIPFAKLQTRNAFVCKGDTVVLNATANTNYTYTWLPNQYLTNNTIHNPGAFPPSDKTYYVQIKDITTLCENKDSVYVKVLAPLPDTRYQNITGCQGEPKIKIKNFSNSNDFLFTWNFGDGSGPASGQEVTHTYSEFGDYTATVTVANSYCSLTDTVHIHLPVVKIPNLFTPNGDNHNDKYVIEGMTDDWKLEVFNRWGNLIYTRQPYDQSWSGDDLSGGVYYFLITDPNGNKCKGWVHVLK